MENLRKNQKEMLEIKDTVTEMKHAFNGLISGLDPAKESLLTLSTETSQTERQREKQSKEKRMNF